MMERQTEAEYLAQREAIKTRRAVLSLRNRQADLFPELKVALIRAINEIDYLVGVPITAYEVKRGRAMVVELSGVLARAEALKGE